MELTHLNKQGHAHMVDITEKKDTVRFASAMADISMANETIELITNKGIKKGDVFSVAQVAGIMAAKKTDLLIPMAHNIKLTNVDISFDILENKISIQSAVKTIGKTGAEMEALNAVTITALTIYDMCKAVDKGMVINNVQLIKKTGGKSNFESK